MWAWTAFQHWGGAGKEKLRARVWLHGIGKFVDSVAQRQASNNEQALATVGGSRRIQFDIFPKKRSTR